MSKHRAFTFVDLFVVLVILVVVIAMTILMLGRTRRSASGLQRTTQVRGIHTSLVLFSQGNNTYYPGIDKDGNRMADYAVAFRFQELLDDNYFNGEYLISPSETKSTMTQTQVRPTTANYSYAMLNLSDRNVSRIHEWRDTSNDKAIVLGDRAIAHGQNGAIKSVHTNPSSNASQWRGSVAWNDNHVTFEATHHLDTQYGEETFDHDNLFDNAGASLVYSGNDTIIDTSKRP